MSSNEQYRRFKLFFVPVLVFSLVGQIAVVWSQLHDIRDGHFDFVLYYNAARIVQDGKGSDLYNLALQRDYRKSITAVDSERDLPYNHLPYEALLLLPLARFSFPSAHAIWAGFNLFILLAIMARLLPFVEQRFRWIVGLMLFAFFPTLTTLKMGQDSIISTYLLVEVFVCLKRERYALAGSVLALGLYKPQLVLPIAGVLLFQRRWLAILGFSLTGVLLLCISLMMVGWTGLTELMALWLPMIDRGNVVWPELMINLRGIVHLLLSFSGFVSMTNTVTFVLSALLYCLTVYAWTRKSNEKDDRLDLRYALAVVTTVLVSFHLYSYDAMLLIIPLILVLNLVLNRRVGVAAADRLFMILVIGMFLPLLPNVLLSFARLAWWALPVPILYWLIEREIAERSKLVLARATG